MLHMIEELDRLLIHFNAKVISYNSSILTVQAYKVLPLDAAPIVRSYQVDYPSSPINFSSWEVVETVIDPITVYTFLHENLPILEEILLKATENERFKAFSTVFDEEIEQNLQD